MNAINEGNLAVDIHHLGTRYADGEIIFREGDPSDALYVVQTGKVRIVSIQSSDGEVEITVAMPGDIFGVTSFFDNLPRCASAVALGPANVLKLERRRILKAVHSDPSLVLFILESVSTRTRKLVNDLTQLKAMNLISKPSGRYGSSLEFRNAPESLDGDQPPVKSYS